jgi:chromosome segregation ATPase
MVDALATKRKEIALHLKSFKTSSEEIIEINKRMNEMEQCKKQDNSEIAELKERLEAPIPHPFT